MFPTEDIAYLVLFFLVIIFNVILGSMESQTPRNFTLFSGHLKFFSGKSFSLFPAIDPIHKALYCSV